jgi:CHAD domain-containing protein
VLPPTTGKLLLDPQVTAGDAAFLLLHRDQEEFASLGTQVVTTEDPEAVHDMRVAARRIRVALKVFAAFLPAGLTSQETHVKWMFHLLGEVRDLDIEINLLTTTCDFADSEVIDLIREERIAAKERVNEAIRSDRYTSLISEARTILSKGPSKVRGLAAVPLLAAAPDLAERAFRQTRKIGQRIRGSSSDENIHRLRKSAKRLRYTLEFFSDLFPERVEHLIKELKNVQDLLGERQDRVILAGHLRRLGSTGEAHKLSCDLEAEAKAMAKDIHPALRRALGKPWKRLHKDMVKRRKDLWKSAG